MYIGSLSEVCMIQESKKPGNLKKAKNIFNTSPKKDKDFWDSYEAQDQMSGVIGTGLGAVGGIPGMVAGAAGGYLIPKAMRKAARWLDK